MIKFGPAGMCDDFKKKHSQTMEMPPWLSRHGLTCFEMSFTNGVRLSDETATKFGEIFKKTGIEVSVHAPYFINFANPLNVEKSNGYIMQCLDKMKLMGARKLVFHAGSLTNLPRQEAFENIYNSIKELIKILDSRGYDDFLLCPETMGKQGQIGTAEEIAKICAIDDRIIPTIDFGHINALTGGSLKSTEDYEKIFSVFKQTLGERFNRVHIHFSKIQYGSKGEIRHLTFKDKEFGPEFEQLAPVLKKLNVDACVICESSGTQTKDACTMSKIFNCNHI